MTRSLAVEDRKSLISTGKLETYPYKNKCCSNHNYELTTSIHLNPIRRFSIIDEIKKINLETL